MKQVLMRLISFRKMFVSRQYPIVAFIGFTIWFLGSVTPGCAAPHAAVPPVAASPAAAAPSANQPSLLDKGISLCNAGKYQEAISCLQQYIATAPNDSQGQFWLGTTYLDAENYAQAEPAFRKAISLLPADVAIPELHVNLGNTLLALNKTDDAIQQYRLAIKINPNEPRAHLNLGRALIDKGNPVDSFVAIDELKKTEQLGLKFPNMLYLQAKANIDLGNFKEARSLMTDFLSTISDNADNQNKRKAAQSVLDSINSEISKRDQAAVPTPPQKRHYELKSGTQYVVTKMNKDMHLVTMASSDKQDPDGGKQDGFNDGIFEMPDSELNQQVQDRGQVWRRSENAPSQ